MQGFFEAEGFAIVSASSNVVVELMSIAITIIRGRCDASDREISLKVLCDSHYSHLAFPTLRSLREAGRASTEIDA